MAIVFFIVQSFATCYANERLGIKNKKDKVSNLTDTLSFFIISMWTTKHHIERSIRLFYV